MSRINKKSGVKRVMSVYAVDKHDLTVYPEGLNDYQSIEEWRTYENTEFDAEENNRRAVEGIKRLFGLSSKVWMIKFNDGETVSELDPNERITNFMFDFAVIGLSEDDIKWLHYYIMKYRFTKIDDPRTDTQWSTRAMLAQVMAGMYIDKHNIKHIQGIWS